MEDHGADGLYTQPGGGQQPLSGPSAFTGAKANDALLQSHFSGACCALI